MRLLFSLCFLSWCFMSSYTAAQVMDDVAVTNEDTSITFSITNNDADPDGIDPASVDLDLDQPGKQDTNVQPLGTFKVDALGVVEFTPNADVSGIASIKYSVANMNGQLAGEASITVTINAVNDPPVANDDTGNTRQNTAVVVNVTDNDTDIDGTINPSGIDLNLLVPGIQTTRVVLLVGTFEVVNPGEIRFTPLPTFTGLATVQYTVTDNEGATSNPATLSITVVPNVAPVAVNDVATTNENTQVFVNILDNDFDVDGTLVPATIDLDVNTPGIQSTRQNSFGMYSLEAGELKYEPQVNFNGVATIRYTVHDNDGATSNEATVTITVISVNTPPVAVDDVTSTNQNTPIPINILLNDEDDSGLNPATVDLDPATPGIQTFLVTSAGSYTVNASGIVSFSPVASFFGVTTITYTVNDTEGLTSNAATITITVNRINQAPVANNDIAETDEDVEVNILVLTNDTDDVALNPASVDLNTGVAGIQQSITTNEGIWSVDPAGVVTYAPKLNFNGTATLTYRVSDNEGAVSNNGIITVIVNAVNDPPVAMNDVGITNEDTPLVINVLANDTDVDGTLAPATVDLDPATPGITSTRETAEGKWSANAGLVTYVPTVNFFGTATISYTVQDNLGATSNIATITITVNSVNDPPVAVNDQANTNSNQSVTFNILTNDIDVDGTINPATTDLDPATPGRQVSRTIASGTFTIDNVGQVTFMPTTNFSGSTSIQYTVADNLGAVSNIATITVFVNFVNNPPVAVNDAVSTNEDTPVSFNVVANDTDDGTINAATVDLNIAEPGIQSILTIAAGQFVVNGAGIVTFTPSLNFNGTVVIEYTVNDNVGATSNAATITVTVIPVNDAPVAVDDNASTNEDTPVSVNVIANDFDVDGTIDPASVDLNPATAEVESTRTIPQGTFTVNTATGVVTFTPIPNYHGTVAITYNVKDNLGLKSNNATLTITVLNVNDPPTFQPIADQIVLRNAATRVVTITGISPGPLETEQVLITAISNNTALIDHPTIVYNGTAPTATLSFRPKLNQSGTAVITVRAVDTGFAELVRTFTITVVDARITSIPVTTALLGEPYQYNVTISALDPLDLTLNLVTTQKPAWATLTSTGKNTATLSGVPPANAPKTSTIIIQLREGAAVIDEQQFTLLINQRPIVNPVTITINEDVVTPLPVEKFLAAFADPDNNQLAQIQFTQLPDPERGVLKLNDINITPGQIVNITLLSSVVYSPAPNFNGQDNFAYKGGDDYSFSLLEAQVSIIINPVNDAPEITSIESDPLQFDIGRELAQIFTAGFNAVDIDNTELQGAEIGFRLPNFDSDNDVLIFNNTSLITGTYDARLGVLVLTGTASVQEYVNAIRTIEYNFIGLQFVKDLEAVTNSPRSIYITLTDGLVISEPAERIINLIFTHIPLAIPNVFTPDALGNRVWKIREKGDSDTPLTQYSDAVIRVFNRQGVMVFENVGFGIDWDGTNKGKQLPVDTYFYTIDLKYGRIKYKGAVTIMKRAQ